MGECLEYFIEKNIIADVCGFAKSDKPQGLLKLSLNWLSDFLSTEVIHSTEIMNYR